MKGLNIGELARQVDANIETIRYYERRGVAACAATQQKRASPIFE